MSPRSSLVHLRVVAHLTLYAAVMSGCQTTINVYPTSDTSQQDSESGGDGTGGSTGAPQTTGGSTGKPDSTGSSDSSGELGTSGTSDTSGKPDTTDGSTGKPDTTGADTTSGSTGKPDTTGDGSSTGTSSTTGEPDTTSTDGSSTTGGGDLLDGWTRYREILIDNGEPTEFKDLQVFVDIKYDADMAPDYADLRFTDATGSQLLPYWIERDTGPANAYVWVRVPVVVADDITTIRVYYGNPNAEPGSSGTDTFLFFDGFDGASLDPLKWKSTAAVTVDFGWLKLTKGAAYSAKTIAGFPGTILEARMKWYFEGGNPSASVLMASQGPTTGAGLDFIRRGRNFGVAFDGENTTFQGQLWDAMDAIAVVGVGVATQTNFLTGHGFDMSTAPPLAFNYYAILGHIAGKNADQLETQNVDVDWVLVRRHAKPAPVCYVGGEKTP